MYLLIGLILWAICHLCWQDSLLWTSRTLYCEGDPSRTSFPLLIHQTWKTEQLSSQQEKLVASLKRHYPDYRHTLWTDHDMELYVATRFAWYLPVWNQLSPFIKKVDTIRYMWMYDLGGIYADLDTKCLRNAQHLLGTPGMAYIPASHSTPTWRLGSDRASPAFLASYPGNPVWLLMLKRISGVVHLPTLAATGPIGLADLLHTIHRINHDELRITVLSEAKWGVGWWKGWASSPYMYHENHGTWGSSAANKRTAPWSCPIHVLDALNELLPPSLRHLYSS